MVVAGAAAGVAVAVAVPTIAGWEVGTAFGGWAAAGAEGNGLRKVNAPGRGAAVADEVARCGPEADTGADEGAAPKLSCWCWGVGTGV